MKKYSKILILLSLLIIIICIPTILHAQPDPAGDPDAPIDGGLGILLAAGVGYGVKKMRDNRRKRNLVVQNPE